VALASAPGAAPALGDCALTVPAHSLVVLRDTTSRLAP